MECDRFGVVFKVACVCVHACACTDTVYIEREARGQTEKNQFSPTLWVLGIKLGPSGLVTVLLPLEPPYQPGFFDF